VIVKIYKLEKDEWWTRKKINAFCTLQHFAIESAYVSLVVIASQSNNNNKVKSPLDDQVIDSSFIYFLYTSFMIDLSLSLSVSIFIQLAMQ
jgi:hypothetical protein